MSTHITIDQNLLNKAMQLTHFHNSQELVENALQLMIQSHIPPKLSEFLQQSPLAGLDLDLERNKDTGRDINT